MYNNLIEEDIMILDNEFFKIDTMFETVNKMYDIKMKELEYNYIYTESINEEYIDLYTEAEVAKDKKEQGLLGRLFTAILNFIRKIRAKILRFFGNDKKASELEAKIKGNPKLANQTVEITNTIDAEKAIDEGTSFFGGLIDKIVKGTATEADADVAEEKSKSLLGRIGIFAGGALLAAGGAKVASDKLKEHGVTKQTIKETVSNLFKREEDTKKKAAKVTQENEQTVQKGDQALKNNSQSGNEENTKAGRRIMGSFKGFITDVGKFFTGKASEIRSKINGVSSGDKDDTSEKKDNKNNEVNKKQEQVKTKSDKPEETESKTKPENKVEKQPGTSTTDTAEQKNGKNDKTKLNDEAEQDNQNNKQQTLRQEENEPQPKKNDKKKDSTKDEQQTSTSQARPKNTNTQQANDESKPKFSKFRPDSKVEKQPENKSDNQDHKLSPKEKMDDEIKILLNTFLGYTSESKDGPATISLKKKYIDNGKSIVSPEDRSKIDFSTGFSMSPENIVEIAKRFLDSYKIYSKYKNPDKNKVKEVLKNICGDDYEDDFLDEEMNDIKTRFTALDKCAKELNELIKKRETFKESSYDLINDILTIFENSF